VSALVTPLSAQTLKVGMVTNAGTVDDRNYNQATWEGLQAASQAWGVESTYKKPSTPTSAAFLEQIEALWGEGNRVIVTSGFVFEAAIFDAQDRYRDTTFILIDGVPNNGRFDAGYQERVGRNAVSVFFREEQAGFLAGVASAVQVRQGAFGFIGGMEILPVKRYQRGFEQGVQYANDHFGTSITLDPVNRVYQGTFSDYRAGQRLAATMYDRGVKVIFVVAGGVGWGVIKEAQRRASPESLVVGVDVDQYAEGLYASGKSVILTSAIKRVDVVAASMVKAVLDRRFPGGQIVTLGVAENAVGIPTQNPNLGPQALQAVDEVTRKLQSGEITVQGD